MSRTQRSPQEQTRFDEIARRVEKIWCNSCTLGTTRDGDECQNCDGLGELVYGVPYRNLEDAVEALEEMVELGRKQPRDLHFWYAPKHEPRAYTPVWVATRRLEDGARIVVEGSFAKGQWTLPEEADPNAIFRWRYFETAPDYPIEDE